MMQSRIDIRTEPQTFSAYSGALAAALVSAALVTQPPTRHEFPRNSNFADGGRHASKQGEQSFQATGVLWATSFDSPRVFLNQFELAMAELEALPRNWDGQGAEPVSKEAIAKAKSFLASLGHVAATFEPFADPDGSVGLEGHKNGKTAYMTISVDGRIAYVVRDGDTVHRGKDVDAATMRNLLNVLY